MKRGEIYSAVGKGDFSRKPRPALIIQSDAFNEVHPSATVCPITSILTGDFLQRVAIESNSETGLLHNSEVQIDKVQAIEMSRFGERIGLAPEHVMARVDEGLRVWLDL